MKTRSLMRNAVSFDRVSRHFGDVRAVDDVSLEISEGEFFAMLGPSGSGKTTCLRLIAGFDQPTSGQISIFGEAVSGVPPYRRSVNTVFQDYALFPHLNVADNVAFGLKIKGIAKAERHKMAIAALDMVQLPGFGDRKTAQLSGGQRQRVALARALVNQPRVLLLDEPLGALDLKLREQMQEELKALQQHLGITFVFVTHDQGEALSLADRVAVFSEGGIQQIDTPKAIYERPASQFVADFVGSSNVLKPELVERLYSISSWASLRPEKIRIVSDHGYNAIVTGQSYLGSTTRITLDMDGHVLSCMVSSDSPLPAVGASVTINWERESVHLMEKV